MRIYVAAKWGEATNARARQVMDELRAAGHKITYDWTQDPGEGPQQAMKDLNGVLTADIFVVIAEATDVVYCGTICELGMALAQGMPIYMLGNALRTKRDVQGICVFANVPGILGEADYQRDLLGNEISPANERDHSDEGAPVE